MGSKTTNLASVIQEEHGIIEKRRARIYPGRVVTEGAATNLVGLALSGGGIRSAVTNLGVLYEMSRVGLFRIVDYLSTVSGGGYIGCCASSLLSIKKPDPKPLEGENVYTYSRGDSDLSLFSSGWKSFPFRDLPVHGEVTTCDPGQVEKSCSEDTAYCSRFTSRDQVYHLRDRASYLVPSLLPFGSHVMRVFGAVSAATLSSLVCFGSMLVIITTLYMYAVFPEWHLDNIKWAFGTSAPVTSGQVAEQEDTARLRVEGKITGTITDQGTLEPRPDTVGWAIGFSPLEIEYQMTKATESIAADNILQRASAAIDKIWAKVGGQLNDFSEYGKSRWICFLLGMVWGVLAPFCMHWRGNAMRSAGWGGGDQESFLERKQLKCISLATIALLVAVLIAGHFLSVSEKGGTVPSGRLLLPVVCAMGSLVGSLMFLWILAGDYTAADPTGKNPGGVSGKRAGRSCLPSWNRVSRTELSLCSGIFLYCLAGAYIFAILPAFILSGNAGFIACIQAVAILCFRYYLPGIKGGAEKTGGGTRSVLIKKVKGQLMGLLVPLVLLLAVIGIAASLGGLFFGPHWNDSIKEIFLAPGLAILFVAAFLTASLLRLNFNNISPHVFYKDRLAEAFLTTFRYCRANNDSLGNVQERMSLARNLVEMQLADLHGNEPSGESGQQSCAARGPYLLINATLNLTAARDLKGYRRQSENFLFSRCYTGSERTGYLATEAYDPPIELGRAMTISGAALTSVMGAQGSLAASFACTILGVRLGYWLRNPVDMAKTMKKKVWNWKNLFYELFRYTDSRDSHIYLSDGGHCGDNLGLLALLQRRTKLIIVSDAECDKGHFFNSLNNSIRRAYVDSNIKIQISLDDLRLDDNGFARRHYAIGRILYPDRPWQRSWLLVIKNTMTGGESLPIANYRRKSPDFPHESTADQFFTEEQFEVYRSLGREACREIWEENITVFRSQRWLQDPWSCIDHFCRGLSPGNHKWDDIIRAIWQSERGDMSTWQGFFEIIEQLHSTGGKDGSDMVQRLNELHQWLQENKNNLPLLQGKLDVPRTWYQFEGIRYHLARETSGRPTVDGC